MGKVYSMTIKYSDSKRIVATSADVAVVSNRGTIDTSSSAGNTIITFTESGTFTPTSPFNVEYLVVAGGGGGGAGGAAGGGAGGFKTDTGFAVTPQNYDITVGEGGAGGGINTNENGSKGSDSIFSTITSEGGGYGGGDSIIGGDGGSGGGGGKQNSKAGGSGTVGQGNDGGDSAASSGQGSGGGGGSSVVGSDGNANAGGNGGAGTANPIVGSSAGVSGYLAGGGGGSGSGGNGSGGSGGGGAGTWTGNVTGVAGTVNTGSGGGGGGEITINNGGGAGGSGIVIIKFATSGNTYSTSAGGKPTDVQDNSILVEKDTARRYWFDAGAESNVELTTGAPFVAHGTGWTGKAWISELSDLPNVGDVVTGGKIYVGTSAGNVRLGLYSDNGSGVPQTLLAETASTAVGSAGAWQEIDFISSYTTTSTDKLHLGLQTDSSGSGFGYATNVSLARSEMVTSYGAFPTTFSGTSDNTPADLRAVVERPAAPTWTMNPTFEDDFTSDTWTDINGIGVNTTNQTLGGTFPRGAIYKSYKPITALSDTSWVMRFKFNLTSHSGSPTGVYIGVTDTSNATDTTNTNRDAIMFWTYSDSGVKYAISHPTDTVFGLSYTDMTTTPANGDVYYVELKRTSATTGTCSLYNDSGFSDLEEAKDFTIPSGASNTGLDNILITNLSDGGSGGTTIATIEDLKIYNGVTTPN
jgi:hypothetical protein